MSTENKLFYIGAKGVVINTKQKKALLLISTDEEGNRYYDIPGGRIDNFETLDEALSRELGEEIANINGDFEIGRLLNAYRLPHDLVDGYGLMLIFHKVESSITEVELSHEHEGYKWVGLDELGELELSKDPCIYAGYLDAVRLALK